MRSTSPLLTLAFGVLAAISTPLSGPLAAQAPAPTLRVTVRYTGAGQVDAVHKVIIWLFDSPDFMTNPGASMPIATSSLERNGDVATFPSVGAAQVWIATMFDQTGGFDGSGPPPSGSPVGVYMENGQPTPIAPASTGTVTVSFDDSFRVPVSRR
jgi:hypothetical protein